MVNFPKKSIQKPTFVKLFSFSLLIFYLNHFPLSIHPLVSKFPSKLALFSSTSSTFIYPSYPPSHTSHCTVYRSFVIILRVAIYSELRCKLNSTRHCLFYLSAVQYITIELIWPAYTVQVCGVCVRVVYGIRMWYIWLSDTRPNKLTLFINAWYFINNTNVDRKAITALATHRRIYCATPPLVIAPLCHPWAKIADAVRQIAAMWQVAIGKSKGITNKKKTGNSK